MAMENAAQGHTTVDKEEAAVEMNWQSGNSNNNRSDNSGSYESPKDELSYLLEKRGGAQKGSDEPYPNYIPEEEIWYCRSSFRIIIIVACSPLNLLIQFVGSQS
jgi:hypothetical protein